MPEETGAPTSSWMEQREARVLPDDLVQAFTRLAKGDFTVRLQRNFQRDTDDAIAFFVNVIAEQLARLVAERERVHEDLSAGVALLSENFLALAAGDFSVRASTTGRRDALDTLARMFNVMAVEVGTVFADHEKQRALLEATLESMVDGVVLLSAKGIIQRANGAMGSLLGHDARELVGQPIESVLAETESAFAASLRDLVTMTPFKNRDTLFRPARGEPVRMAVNGSPHRGADGSLLGIVLVARDDRELKELETQLQVADRLATMGTVAAGVAHEINNPLAYVMSNLQFVTEELATLAATGTLTESRIADVTKALAASREGARRVKQIVGDLRTFSRAESATPARLDVNTLMDSALALIQNELRHHARLSKEYGTVPAVLANEGRLVQVFLNLIQNAAQAIPVGSAEQHRIRIVTGTDPTGMASVELHDTGCGIPAEQLPHIFDLFFTTKTVGVGTGLGLSICHRIVESVGGRIEVKSTVGAGSMFRILLPPAPPESSIDVSSAAPVAGPQARALRVLVIDDEREICESIQRVLKDHQVDTATSAALALELTRDIAYDVVLCDLLMPTMTGMELHALLAKDKPALAERMIFMTGGPFGHGVREFLARVTNPRIDKPFDAEELLPMLAVEGARRE
ncbi:MAG: sensor histidine kinase [Labilithrix sp.]|nr:sensor histidine kinase [Labilithrix sp.]